MRPAHGRRAVRGARGMGARRAGPMTGRPWPSPARLERARANAERYCVNCWFRLVPNPGDGLCSRCRPAYEAALARAASLEDEGDLEPAPRELPAPAISEYVHPADCPCDRCEDARRRALRLEGLRIPGLSPKNEWGEPEL
jgi:hypothetical protein